MTLSKLVRNGCTHGIFSIKTIGEIHKSPAKDAITEVIDFDETKCKLTQILNQPRGGFNEFKSCDALKIVPESDIIDFIEFKGFADFKRYNAIQSRDDANISEQIEKFHLDEKLFDSCTLFDLILKMSQLQLSNEDRRKIQSIARNYFVLVDLKIKENPVQDLAVMLDFLSDPLTDIPGQIDIDNVIHQKLQNKLDSMELPLRINRPKLMSADVIDRYYQRVNHIQPISIA